MVVTPKKEKEENKKKQEGYQGSWQKISDQEVKESAVNISARIFEQTRVQCSTRGGVKMGFRFLSAD